MCVDMYGVCMPVYELCRCFQRPEARVLFFHFPSDFCWRQGLPPPPPPGFWSSLIIRTS